jgi:GNAT superfamily N-acetyltransferase
MPNNTDASYILPTATATAAGAGAAAETTGTIMMMNTFITGVVGRTAVDALHAKTSADVNPLVQIGYRIRTRTLQEIVDRFFFFVGCDVVENKKKKQKKNLLVIGAGLDLSIGLHTVQTVPQQIHVVELDRLDVCRAKRNILLKSYDWMIMDDDDDHNHNETTTTSLIDTSSTSSSIAVVCHGTHTTTQSSYTLVAADLHQAEQWISQLREMMMMMRKNLHHHGDDDDDDDDDAETLVISELVLTYLSPTSCDTLLRLLAQQQSNHWHFVAYEPLGPRSATSDDDPKMDTNDDESSILRSYRAEYLQRFRETLQRGEDNNNDTTTTTTTTMTPLGSSLRHVRDRLQTAGFRYSYARFPTAQSTDFTMIASTKNNKARPIPAVLFDEHAALALHLQSYVVTIASHDWWTCRRLSGNGPTLVQQEEPNEVWLCTALNNNDDEDDAIRTAFRATYAPFFVPHPAIRKLCEQVEREGSFRSNIGGWYQQRGGNFWILVTTEERDDDDASSPIVVIGGLGLRKLDDREATKRKLPRCPCFEMERVFVTPAFRGRGLAKVLMKSALKFAGPQSTIVAITLSVLEEANQLYSNFGFARIATEQKGSLTYCTYTRLPEKTKESKR